VRKASHFAVYNNLAGVPSLAGYPAGFPGQYTVGPSGGSHTSAGAAPVGAAAGDTAYDITVTGPNRFLRRFTGDTAAAGAQLPVCAEYIETGFGDGPRLRLTLTNMGPHEVTFAVTANAYSKDRPRTYRVPRHRSAVYSLDPLHSWGGWYDLTVTASSDASWSQRFVGHLENGEVSITGV
jgi:phospholipase C